MAEGYLPCNMNQGLNPLQTGQNRALKNANGETLIGAAMDNGQRGTVSGWVEEWRR